MEVSDLREAEILAHLEDTSRALPSAPVSGPVSSCDMWWSPPSRERKIGSKSGSSGSASSAAAPITTPGRTSSSASKPVRSGAASRNITTTQSIPDCASRLPPGSYAPWFHGATSPANPATGGATAARAITRDTAPVADSAGGSHTSSNCRSIAQRPSDSVRALFGFPPGSSRTPILCLPAPERFGISGGDKAYLLEELRPRPPEERLTNLSLDRLQGLQIIPETGLALGVGDAHALTLIYAFEPPRAAFRKSVSATTPPSPNCAKARRS